MQEKLLADLMESFISISQMDGFVEHIHKSYQFDLQEDLISKTNISREEFKMLMCTGYFEILKDFQQRLEKRAIENRSKEKML